MSRITVNMTEKWWLTCSVDSLPDFHVFLFMFYSSQCCGQLIDHLCQLVVICCKNFFRESLIKHLFLIALFAYINHKMFYISAILWVVHMSSQILDLWNVESVWKHYQLTLYNFKKSSVIPSLSILSVSLGFSPMSIVNIRIFGVTVDILLLKQYL